MKTFRLSTSYPMWSVFFAFSLSVNIVNPIEQKLFLCFGVSDPSIWTRSWRCEIMGLMQSGWTPGRVRKFFWPASQPIQWCGDGDQGGDRKFCELKVRENSQQGGGMIHDLKFHRLNCNIELVTWNGFRFRVSFSSKSFGIGVENSLTDHRRRGVWEIWIRQRLNQSRLPVFCRRLTEPLMCLLMTAT